MSSPFSNEDDIVCQDFRSDLEVLHLFQPWSQVQCHEHHGQRAPLRDAAFPPVASADAAIDAVVGLQVLSHAGVGPEDVTRHTSNIRRPVKDVPLDLVEDLLNFWMSAVPPQ